MTERKSASADYSTIILALVSLVAAGADLVAERGPNSLEQVRAGNDFYELNVWAANRNQPEAFADMNPSAPCDRTSADDEM